MESIWSPSGVQPECVEECKVHPNHHNFVFLNFLVIYFFLIFWLQCVSYHIWKGAWTMQILLHHYQQEPSSCLFFFPCFMAIFTSVAILENAYRLCRQYLNIIKKSYIMSILFLLSFLDFLSIFSWITILGNGHGAYKQYPNIVNICLQHASSFLLIIPDFVVIFTLLTILGNSHRPCKQYTNIVNNGLH